MTELSSRLRTEAKVQKCMDIEVSELLEEAAEALEMAHNRLEIALAGDGVCVHCIEAAKSYL